MAEWLDYPVEVIPLEIYDQADEDLGYYPGTTQTVSLEILALETIHKDGYSLPTEVIPLDGLGLPPYQYWG